MKQTTGFTLIELLIVVAIIAILAAIAVPNFLEAQTRAKISRNLADMQAVAVGVETYAIDFNMYPPAWEAFTTHANFYIRGVPYHAQVPSRLTTPVAYLNSVPLDPFKNTSFVETDPRIPKGRAAYYNIPYLIKAVTAPNPVNGYALNIYNNIKRVGGNYAIWSYGPDRDFWNTPPNESRNDFRIFRDYDPTNGTISLGNTFRTQAGGGRFGTDKFFYPANVN